MLCWMSHATFKDKIPSKDLLTKFDLLPARRIVQHNRLCWFGHVVRMDDNWGEKVYVTQSLWKKRSVTFA